MRVITAKEGGKTLSIEYNPFSKKWNITKRQGKVVCVIPSQKVLIKVEDYTDKKKKKEQLISYVKERFPDARYHIKFADKKAYLALCRDCVPCKGIEPEPFALARLFSLYEKNGFIIDWGRNKTVFVEIREGFLKSFRVILRGGDYISNRISKEKNVPFERAEALKREQGLALEEVKDAVQEILSMAGYELKGEALMLTGGGSKTKGLKEYFQRVITLREVAPEYAVCLGTCLREVIKNPYPDFKEEEISKKDLRRVLYVGGGLALAFFVSLFGMEKLYSVEELRDIQRAEFKRLFPKEPIVSLKDQVRAKVSTAEEYQLTKLLLKAEESLKPGMKLYTFEYFDGKLTIKGEAPRSLLEGVKVRSLKDIGSDKVEFEVVLP
ncbi:MAG: cell division FtsA domain-containing protein [Aquificaceae bacterium]